MLYACKYMMDTFNYIKPFSQLTSYFCIQSFEKVLLLDGNFGQFNSVLYYSTFNGSIAQVISLPAFTG